MAQERVRELTAEVERLRRENAEVRRENAEVERLRRENAEVREENRVLRRVLLELESALRRHRAPLLLPATCALHTMGSGLR